MMIKKRNVRFFMKKATALTYSLKGILFEASIFNRNLSFHETIIFFNSFCLL